MASEKIFFQKNIQIKIIFEQFVYLLFNSSCCNRSYSSFDPFAIFMFLLHSMNNLSFKNELA